MNRYIIISSLSKKDHSLNNRPVSNKEVKAGIKPQLQYTCDFVLEMTTEHVQKLSPRPEKLRVARVARDIFSNRMFCDLRKYVRGILI